MPLSPSIASLLNPRGVAVIGASQRGGRANRSLINLKKFEFAGEVYAVNPRYEEVLGRKCVPSVDDLPDSVDCLILAIGADAACEVLEQGFRKGIRAAVVQSSGFGEGGNGEERAARLRALAAEGMSICGPNCYGAFNVATGASLFSGDLPAIPIPGRVALVSQSGGLSQYAYRPLMEDRGIGFSHIISCGNQIGTSIEDYAEYFVDGEDADVIAIVFECLRQPRRLLEIARRAHLRRKTLIFFQAGQTAAGQTMVQSHTGALVSDAVVIEAFLRQCGIVQPKSYHEFIETVALFAVAPRDEDIGDEAIVITGSGGASAILADEFQSTNLELSSLDEATGARIRAILPDFGSVTNPVDATGAMFDDSTVLPKVIDALMGQPGRPVIMGGVTARLNSAAGRKHSEDFAAAAKASGRTVVALQYSALGGPLDQETVGVLRDAQVPLLLGMENAVRALRHLPVRRAYWKRSEGRERSASLPSKAGALLSGDFMSIRQALSDHGVPIVRAALASSAAETAEIFRSFGTPVAIKAEVPGLLHKSDVGCVKLGCATADEAAAAYDEIIAAARRAGFPDASQVLIQPMTEGVAEVFAGIVNDPVYGPTISFGLGGIFIEILKDTATEMAPVTLAEARGMIGRIKGAKILEGARGKPAADVEALASMLVKLSEFALVNHGRFRGLDLNPIIVGPVGKGVVAVDLALDPL